MKKKGKEKAARSALRGTAATSLTLPRHVGKHSFSMLFSRTPILFREVVMPSSPTPARSEASRRNGALSRGLVTEEGKERSARNGTRHGLFAAELELTPEEQAQFGALLDDLGRRHRPAGAAEQHWVRQVAVTMLRRERLDALEMRVLDLAVQGADSVHEAGLPSPATLLRYRARLQRNHEHAMRELAAAREARGPVTVENSNPTPDMAGQLCSGGEGCHESFHHGCGELQAAASPHKALRAPRVLSPGLGPRPASVPAAAAD